MDSIRVAKTQRASVHLMTAASLSAASTTCSSVNPLLQLALVLAARAQLRRRTIFSQPRAKLATRVCSTSSKELLRMHLTSRGVWLVQLVVVVATTRIPGARITYLTTNSKCRNNTPTSTSSSAIRLCPRNRASLSVALCHAPLLRRITT